jgi:hypothetical protein
MQTPTMPGEKRIYERFALKQGVVVTLKDVSGDTNNSSSIKGFPLNLSQGGAYIRTSIRVDSNSDKQVTFEIPYTGYSIDKRCQIKLQRQEQNGNSCAIQFTSPLSKDEESCLCIQYPLNFSFDLVKSDFLVINNEIEGARKNRVRIFMTILGCLSTWLIGTVALGLTNNLPPSKWMMIGASLPAVLLAIGIFANVTCVNYLNLRKAYLAILAYYFRNEMIPPGYLGWSHLSINRHNCKKRTRQRMCQVEDKCYQIADEKQKGDVLSLVSDTAESIGKIIGLIYLTLFVVSSGILVKIVLDIVSNRMAFVIGGLSLLVISYLIANYHSLSIGAKSIESYYLQWKKALLYCKPIFSDYADKKETGK